MSELGTVNKEKNSLIGFKFVFGPDLTVTIIDSQGNRQIQNVFSTVYQNIIRKTLLV